MRVPWLTATAGAALWVGLSLHEWLGPAATPGWSRGTVAVVYSVTLFIGWDASRFALHWAMHRVRWLWAFHQVHHSARVLTPLTLYRTHPVETLLYDLRGLLTTALITGVFLYAFAGTAQVIELLGINVLGFVFNLAGSNLRHSHVWMRFGPVERWLLSPAQHQMHHARDRRLEGSNLGTWIALWDRLAGTWRPAPSQAPGEYGLADANHRFDRVGSMLLGPCLDLVSTRGAMLAALAGLWMVPRGAEASTEPAPEPSESADAPEPLEVEPNSPEGSETETQPVEDEGAEASDPEVAEPEPSESDVEPETSEVEPETAPEPGAEASPPVTSEPSPTATREADEMPHEAEADETSDEPPLESVPLETIEPEEPEEDPDETRTVVVGSLFAGDELPRVAGSAHVVSERELERHEYDDVHKVLATVPGVYVRGEDGFGLRPNIGLRGANPDRSAKITLLEDGVLLGPAPYSAPAAYYFPLTTRMVGMEVFKGPASIQHGPNTIGGAVNLITREIPLDHVSEVDLAGGRFGYGKGHAFYGTTYKGFGVLVEAARVQTRGFKELDTGGDTGFAKNDAMVKLGYETPSGRRVTHDIELKGGLATEDSNETYLGLSRGDFEATPYRRYAASERDNMGWWRSQAELTYVLRQEETLEIEARLYRHDFDRTWTRLDSFRGGPALTGILAEPDAGQAAVFSAILRGEQDSVLPQHTLLVTNNGRRFVSQGLQTAFRWLPKWKTVEQELEVGARIHNDSIARNHTEDAFLMTSGRMISEGTPRADTVRNRGETVAAAFHVHDAVTLWDRLTIAPGVRMEVISMRFEDALADERSSRLDLALTPGIGVLGMATPWLGFFGGVHRGFSPVAPGQPAEVRPEVSMSYEAGARANLEGLWLEAVGFVSDYSNLVGACTFSAGCVDGDGSDQFNAGAVLVYGVESLARYRYGFESGLYLEFGGRYTYTGSRFSGAFASSFPQWGDVAEGDQLPYVPEHQAGGSVGVGGRIWDVSVSPSYSGAMRDVAGQGVIADDERIDGFFVLDLGAEVRVLERFRIYSQLGNVTNNAYVASMRPFGIRPGAPLTFMLGVKASIFP